MSKKIFFVLFVCILSISMSISARSRNTLTPAGANDPQYGGKLTIRTDQITSNIDMAAAPLGNPMVEGINGVWESPAAKDYTQDEWDFTLKAAMPQYWTGNLAESWELPDMATVVLHIRQGVHWQDKEPVNGREFTAYDVEYVYHRLWGLGSGFTKPAATVMRNSYKLESVTATDKYTVVIKTSTIGNQFIGELLDPYMSTQIGPPREIVEKYGDGNDWKTAVGTGPFMLDDLRENVSVTYKKNPDYWGYDKLNPQNRLPYVDEVKVISIPDLSTAIASLRTAKIDYLDGLSLENIKTINATNPELKQVKLLSKGGVCLGMRLDLKPFSDIRVRRALQMSVDISAIANGFYDGTVDATPVGNCSRGIKGYYAPYEEWPEEIKSYFAYNPDGAKKLLAEAGYPNGFKTNVVAITGTDIDMLQILKSFFMEIGVDMEIRTMDSTTARSFLSAGKHDGLFRGTFERTGYAKTLWHLPRAFVTGHMDNQSFVSDPVFDALNEKLISTPDEEEYKRISREIDMYITSHQWRVFVLPTYDYCSYQPYLNNYTGVIDDSGPEWARYWIDK